jgi:hypothetical protein
MPFDREEEFERAVERDVEAQLCEGTTAVLEEVLEDIQRPLRKPVP